MKTKYKTILIVILALLVLWLFWFFTIRKKGGDVVVQTVKPVYGYISQSVTATGTIQPVDTIAVGTQVSGTIQYIFVDFNSTVKKGELLAQLDKSLLQATVDQFRGSLQTAQSQLVFQKSNFERQNLLYSTESISKAAYESALNSYDMALANVKSAEAQLRSAEKNLSFTNIYSPTDGVVLSRNVSIGQTVAASFSTPTLFVIAKDITKMQVEAAVDEADIGNVAPGQRVEFTVDAFIDDYFKGTVQEIRLHPKVSANVVTYTTIINASNDEMKLKPGMTANITAYTKEVNQAMLIPTKALKYSPDSTLANQYQLKPISNKQREKTQNNAGPSSSPSPQDSSVVEPSYVWIKQGKELVQKRITIGIDDNTKVQVLGGLGKDDDVVVGTANTGSVPPGTSPSSSPFLPRRGGNRR